PPLITYCSTQIHPLPTRRSSDLELLEYTPYLNGGLFRRNALEDRIKAGGEIGLPDDLFDPASDLSVLGLLSRYRFTTRESTPDEDRKSKSLNSSHGRISYAVIWW